MRSEIEELYNMLNANFVSSFLNFVVKVIRLHARISCFCFESGIFTPEIRSWSGKLDREPQQVS